MLIFRYDFVAISNEQNFTFGEYCGHETGRRLVVTGDFAIISARFNGYGRGFIFRFNVIPTGM